MNALMLSYALSGAAGLRAPLTLLALSIAVHTGHLHPGPALAWVGSGWVMGLAALASLIDFAADKIPGVDHAMHAVHTVLAPIIGALAALGGQQGADQSAATVIALLGAGNALLVHGARSSARVASTVTTAGMGSPVLSFFEGGLATVLIVLAFVAPVAAVLLLVLVTVLIARWVRWLARRRTADARAP
jgi:hypothetical protein